MKTKVAIDNRKISPEDQRKAREIIIKMRLGNKTNKEAADASGYSCTHASTIWQKYQNGKIQIDGKSQLNWGRSLGKKRKIAHNQEMQIKAMLLSPPPPEYNGSPVSKLKLWDKHALQNLFNIIVGCAIPYRTVFEYLNRWGISCVYPFERASIHYGKEYDQWKKSEYPEIRARLRKEKAEVVWLNFTDITEQFTAAITESIPDNGDTSHNPPHVMMLSAISNRNKLRFILVTHQITAEDFYDFVLCIAHDCERNLFLVSRCDMAHKSKKIDLLFSQRTYREQKLELHCLPQF